MTLTLSAFADEAADAGDAQIAALKRAGIDHIDLRSVGGVNICELPIEDAKALRSLLDAAQIRVGMYGSPIGKTDLDDDLQIELDRLDHLAAMRDVFGATAVRMFSFYDKSRRAPAQREQLTLERLATLREHAARLGLKLYHENETDVFGDHPDDVLKLAPLRDDASFGLIYDFANYLRTGAEPMATWAKLGGVTDALHFKDQTRGGDHVPMGRGDTCCPAILAQALASGWSGPCTLEPHLYMSEAVRATNVHGQGDPALAKLSREDIFQVAAEAVLALIAQASA
ncbi:MAG: sugar phosphate isomerase/epimerase family protein [Phycisphaerales bacterium JB063]